MMEQILFDKESEQMTKPLPLTQHKQMELGILHLLLLRLSRSLVMDQMVH